MSVTPKDFLDACTAEGFACTVRGNIVTITKRFTPGDIDAFVECDCIGPLLLNCVPLKGGSVWGTDGGSVGGVSAVARGRYTLNKSGYTGKRFTNALVKLINEHTVK
jgi:hypothetical protein